MTPVLKFASLRVVAATSAAVLLAASSLAAPVATAAPGTVAGMINTFGKIYNSIAGLVNGIMNALAIPLSVINFLRTGDLGNYKVKGLPTFDQLMAQNPASNRPVSTQQAEAMFAASGGSGASGASGGAPASLSPVSPKAVKAPESIFDNTSGNAGGFAQAGIGGIGPFDNLTINLDAGLISSPATIGQDIIDAILAAQRNSGVVFAPAGTL